MSFFHNLAFSATSLPSSQPPLSKLVEYFSSCEGESSEREGEVEGWGVEGLGIKAWEAEGV